MWLLYLPSGKYIRAFKIYDYAQKNKVGTHLRLL